MKDKGETTTARRYWLRARDRMAPAVRYMVDFSLGSAALTLGDIYEALFHFNKAHATSPPDTQQRMAVMLMEKLNALQEKALNPKEAEYGILWRTAALGAVLGLSPDEATCLALGFPEVLHAADPVRSCRRRCPTTKGPERMNRPRRARISSLVSGMRRP